MKSREKNVKGKKEEYYLLRDGQKLGPLMEEALWKLCPKGKAMKGDMIWKEGMEDWSPAEGPVSLMYAGRCSRKTGLILALASLLLVLAGFGLFFLWPGDDSAPYSESAYLELPCQGKDNLHVLIIPLNHPMKATELTLSVLSTYGPYGDCTHIAEFELLDEKGNVLPRDGWKAMSSHEAHGDVVSRLLDGNPKTYWHSSYIKVSVAKTPHEVTIKFPKKIVFSALRITHRNFNDAWSYIGRPREVVLEARCGLFRRGDAVIHQGKTVSLPETRYCTLWLDQPASQVNSLTLTIRSMHGNPNYVHLHEFDLLDEDGNPLPRKGWQVEASSVERAGENGDPAQLLDGNINTCYHSAYTHQSHPPYKLKFEFPDPVNFSSIRMINRPWDQEGRPKKVQVDWD